MLTLACSPFLAMCVIKYHAKKHGNEFFEVVSEIHENMYVDDFVMSIDEKEQASDQKQGPN
ncbi:hypothetical protein T12_855 [Trichinella patagoniensis]|uniref:Uncharacterized protein n=1 Tax=Trichinella patagoniensis TaxID=990121 RepID=A0A0V0ZTJ7_9BILA|nr:hypothetical protein T12_855 [Trichinella patagoniensis]